MITQITRWLGHKLAHILNQPRSYYEKFTITDENSLKNILQPGDILLVEGDTRFGIIIKYLTQSTWSHVCLYTGPVFDNKELVMIEADIIEGIIPIPLSKYAPYNVRICRPYNISEEDRQKLISFALSKVGYHYDLKNIFDLLRYFLPLPPFHKYRRKFLKFGSGEPTKAICSTLIAEAFQTIKYPILPRFGLSCSKDPNVMSDDEILCARHHSHFTPRDFDLSPYFQVIKPTIESNFDYKKLKWHQDSEET